MAWIYYNTHVVNEYTTSDDNRAFAANYERKYGHLKGQPIPRFTDVEMEVDLYPESNAFSVRGMQIFENKTGAAIRQMPVGFGFQTQVDAIEIEGAELIASDDEFNVHQYEFEPPLMPGEQRRMTFEVSRTPRGFKHGNVVPSLLGGGGVFGNGTFVNSQALAPYLGFNEGAILTDRNDRWREGLEPVRRAADLDDESQWGIGFRTDSDWVSFKATVTTSADQVAIAPGYLIEESTDLRRAVGPLRVAHRGSQRCTACGLLSPGPRVERRAHHREPEGLDQLFQRDIQPVPVPADARPRVPGVCELRAVVSQHGAVVRRHRLHRRHYGS
jgi:hypothetical protein